MRVFVVLFLIFSSFLSVAQDSKLTLPENEEFVKSDAFFVINHTQKEEVASVIIKDNIITAIQIDDTFQEKKRLSIAFDKYYRGSLVEKGFIGNTYKLYFYQDAVGVVRVLSINFQSNDISFTETNIPYRKQSFLQAFTANDSFYIVTLVRNSSTLMFYSVKDNGSQISKKVELPDYFRDHKRRESNLFENLSFGKANQFRVAKVDDLLPVPISVTGHFSKMYVNDSMFTLTADKNPLFTYIVTVDLTTFEGDVTGFAKRTLDNSSVVTRTNSFIVDNTIYMLATNAKEMYLDVWNIEERKKLEEVSFDTKTDVFLKNPTLDASLTQEEQYELIKNKRLFSNNTKGTKGLSIKKIDDTFLVTIGSTKIATTLGLGVEAGISGAGVGLYPTLTVNVDNLKTRNEIVGFFDKDFKLIKEPVASTTFDALVKTAQKNDFKKIETFFKWKEAIVYGSLNLKTGEIRFL